MCAQAFSIVGGLCELVGIGITLLQIRADIRTADGIFDEDVVEEEPDRLRFRHVPQGLPEATRHRVAGQGLRDSFQSVHDDMIALGNELREDAVEGDNDLRAYIRQLLVGSIRVRLLGVLLIALGIGLATVGSVMAA